MLSSLSLLALILAITFNLAFSDPCGGAGFDLSSLSGRDYYFDVFTPGANNWTYAINPCSALTPSVAPDQCGGQGAMFCQISRSATTTNHSLAVYNASATSWLALPGVGVQASLQDGEYCSTIKANREVSLLFVCNADATTPVVSNIKEFETCHYQATFQTAAACSAQAATGVHQAGDRFISSTCGAGIYNLTSLTTQDLVFDANPTATTGWAYYLRLCGQISTPDASKCLASGPSMACQQSKSVNSTSVYQLAVYNSTSTDIYTLNSNGMTLSIQDGTYCSTIKANRELSVQLICDPTASTPKFVSLAEIETCWYTAVVMTDAVCNRIDTSTTGVAPNTNAASPVTPSTFSALAVALSMVVASMVL